MSHRMVWCLVWAVILTIMSGDSIASCILPGSLQNKFWLRASDKTIIQFMESNMTGNGFQVSTRTYDSFICLLNEGDKYLFKSSVEIAIGAPLDGYFCWQLTNHSSMSYQLYELTAPNNNPDTKNIRIYTTPAGRPTPDINAVCSLNASNETPTYLFEVSSAQDKDINITSLSSLAQSCPPEVQATYSYVVDGAGCNGSDSDLNFCVDRRTARTDYGLCSSRILFSAGGNLTCIAAFRVSGALVVMLLNQDVSLVTSTSRFACMKMETLGDTQRATVFEDCVSSRRSHTLVLNIKATCRYDPEPCTFTQPLQDRFWYRVYDKNILQFTQFWMVGHDLQVGSLEYNNFSCAATRGNTYIIKADAVVKTVQPYLDLYFCWQLTQTSPGAFQVYELTAAEKSGLVAGVRVYTRRAGDPTPDFSAVCSLRSSDETPTYLFEVTSSNATDVDVTSVSAQSCPDAVVAKFSYVHNGAECRDKTSDLDFCVEQTARVNYDLCSAEILFSAGGVLKCIATFSVQGSPVVLLLNTDSSVNDSTSRFACMVKGQFQKLDKVGDITLSTVSEDCKINGSSHTLELTRTGGCSEYPPKFFYPSLTFTVYSSVVRTKVGSGVGDTSSFAESKDNVPLIVGLVVGIAVLAAGVAAGVVCYKRVYKRRRERSVTPQLPAATEPSITQ